MNSDPKSDSSAHWERIDRLLHSALELEPDRRTSFLRDACGGDAALLKEVESLLTSHEQAGSFIEKPALGGAPKRVAAESRVGQKIGPYEVQSLLGSGGMGEIYRATDTRLKRTVAIKFLPAHLSQNPDLRQRLEREARAVSGLNHPHICTLYDIGRDDGSEFLVMEYLEGLSLADRLKKGTLSLEQALQHGIELADALSAAHRQGVIHRDVKPGNVMLVKTGVKLLDFGLAKVSFGPARASNDPPTAQGTILGTLPYMAPEQLEGAEASARTDIFAFGAVLYEMVTGRPAFQGRSQASLIASIMTSVPPPISSVRPVVPDALDHVIQRCLAKDPEERWQNAYDLKRELQWIADTVSKSTSFIPSPPRSVLLTLRRPLGWGLIAVGLAVGLSLATLFFSGNGDDAPDLLPIPFRLELPPNVEIANDRFGAPAISPDGSRVVFSAVAGGKSQLYVKAINSLELPQPLEHTEDAFHPFWSADGSSIGFFSDGRLRTVPSSGGKVTPLCEAGIQGGGAWNGAGDIVYGGGNGGVLSIVSKGGTCKPLTTKRGGEAAHLWPYFLPDGRHFIYSVGAGRNDSGARYAVYIGSLDEPTERIPVYAERPSNVIYAQGHLLFVSENELWAQRFDDKSFKLEGEATRLPVGEVRSRNTGRGYVSVSTNGQMTYRPWSPAVYQVVQFDRKGNSKPIGEIPHEYLTIHLSPDEKKIAYFTWPGPGQMESSGRIELLDVSNGARSTFNPDQKARAGRAPMVWSPVENLLYFATIRCGVYGECPQSIFKVTPGHSERVFTHPGYHLHPLDISSDGKYLLIAAIPRRGEKGPDGQMVLWHAELTPEPKLHEVEPKEYLESRARLSPNGSLLAYTAGEADHVEVYIRSFPVAEGWTPVSRGPGYNPHWGDDGREIVYVTPKGVLMSVSVDVRPGSGITLGTPKKIFTLPVEPPPTRDPADANWWTMSADGKSFYVAVTPPKDRVTVLVNWTKLLKQ